LVQGYDGTQGAGNKRDEPADTHDVSTFTVAGFSWKDGGFTAGDWVVLRSSAGVCGNSCELYIELESTTAIYWFLIPYDNFDTAAAEASPPAFPANAIGYYGLIGMAGWTTGAVYSAVADEAMVAVLFDDNTTPALIYVGEVDPARLTGVPADDRPFIIWTFTNRVYARYDSTSFARVSPIDDTTLVYDGYCGILYAGSSFLYATGTGGGFLGLWDVYPILAHFSTGGHRHTAGYLRNVGFCNVDAGVSGTIAGKTWMYRSNGGGSFGPFCFAWDGSAVGCSGEEGRQEVCCRRLAVGARRPSAEVEAQLAGHPD
jgi:hypothetical protein